MDMNSHDTGAVPQSSTPAEILFVMTMMRRAHCCISTCRS